MAAPVTRWQVITPDPAGHAAFYEKLFGWTTDADNALAFRQVATGAEGGMDGGFWPAPPDTPPFVQLYVQVEDVPACFARATKAGAEVIAPPQALPDGDYLAILKDPKGMPFGLVGGS
jgi:predicted enzyme related to lactoylglutathione lyase